MRNFVGKLVERSRRTVRRLLEKSEIFWDRYEEKFLLREDNSEVTGLKMQKKYREEEDSEDDDEEIEKDDQDKEDEAEGIDQEERLEELLAENATR